MPKIICMTHNHNYPHQVDGDGACRSCERESRQEQNMSVASEQAFEAPDEQKPKKKSVKISKNGSFRNL